MFLYSFVLHFPPNRSKRFLPETSYNHAAALSDHTQLVMVLAYVVDVVLCFHAFHIDVIWLLWTAVLAEYSSR